MRSGVAALAGAAMVMLCGPLSSVADLDLTVPTLTKQLPNGTNYVVLVTQHALPALWTAAVAATVLIPIAVGRALHAASRSS